MIEHTFGAYAVCNQDVATLYQKCSEVANGSKQYDLTEWKHWMLGASDEIYPQYEDELMPKLIESGYFNQHD